MPRLDADLRFSRGAPRDRGSTLAGMKLTHSVLSLTLAAGLAGSVAAYRATSGEVVPTPPAPAAQSSPPTRQVVVPGTRFAWAPCKPGSHLEHGTCVVEVVRTVVLPAAVPVAQTGGGTGSLPVRGSGQEESEAPESHSESESEAAESEAPESESAEPEDGEDHENGEDHEDGEDEPGEDEPGDNG